MAMATENYSCHPDLLEWFSIQVLINLENFKLMLNLSLFAFRAQVALFVMKARKFEPLNVKGKILQQYE